MSFTVKDGDTVVGTYKLGVDFKQNADGTYELKTPIEVDDSIKTFTVEETLKTKEGYTISTSYSVDGGIFNTGKTATLDGVSEDSSKPTTVEYANSYERIIKPGYINITKTIKGDVTQEDLDGLSFTVKDGDTVVGTYKLGVDFKQNADGTYELKTPITVDDSAKTFTVEETLRTVEGFTVSTSYSVNGGTSNNDTKATLDGVSEDADKPTTVAYENDYKRIIKPGYINITKTIKGDVTQEDLDGLSFTVKDGDTVVGTYKLGVDFKQDANGAYELKTPIKVEDSVKTYTVEETLKTKDGYTISTSYSVDGGASATGKKATLDGVSEDATKPSTVAYENDYQRIIKPGYINITKTIKGDVTQEDLDGLSFTVKDGDTVVGTYKLGVDFKQNTDGTYELKTPIKVDDSVKTYSVEETLKTKDGYIISTSYSVDGGASATGKKATLDGVSEDATKPSTVAYENDYQRIIKPGYINITKTIKGDVTEEDLNGLTFVVKDGNKTVGSYKLGVDFKQNADGTYELKTPIKVEDSANTYTVEETLYTVEGFTVSVSYKVNGAAKPDGAKATLNTVSENADKPTTVAYENDYTKIIKPGYITQGDAAFLSRRGGRFGQPRVLRGASRPVR